MLLVRAVTDRAEGWGECVAAAEPRYSSEYADGATDVLRRFLVPAMAAVAGSPPRRSARPRPSSRATAWPRPHWRWRCSTPGCGRPAAGRMAGRDPRRSRPASRSASSIGARAAGRRRRLLDQGYRRMKLKVDPGWDLEPVRAVREHFGDDLLLQVDANAAYTLADAGHLAELDRFGLRWSNSRLRRTTWVGRHLARRITTPVCLDESITSADVTAGVLAMGACAVVNVKPGRVGGYLEAARVHDVCLAAGAPLCVAGCSKPVSAGPRTSPSPPCPASACPATPRPPTATTART